MNSLEHYARLQRFIQERHEKDIYPEVPTQAHIHITQQMIERLNRIMPLKGKNVLDCGCGQGLALEEFSKLGAHPIGITFGEDYQICKKRGYEVYEMDQSFLDFESNHFDLIWCRHALEHSLFPLFTLKGFYEVLKPDGILYIEVPAPDTDVHHENNQNHYSCFTKNAWIGLFLKANFPSIEALDLHLLTDFGGEDLYHIFMLKKSL